MTEKDAPEAVERRRGSGAKLVYDALRDEILDLVLAPGSAIDEVELAERFGMIATNAAFHLAIAEAGRNPYFTALFKRLLDEGRRILRLYYQSYDDRLPHRFVGEHEEMIAAIAARDLAASDELGRTHADQIVEQVRKLLVREERLDLTL